MLRIIHTADWHLGHQLHGVSRHFEHQQFLNWLLDALVSNEADALIVAGDIFDSANPPATAQAQLYDFLVNARTSLPGLSIILVGGNHDSASRLDAPSPILNALSELSERKILGGNQHALPLELFPENIAYVALGHLHLAQHVGGKEHIRYSGSPIPMSFDESDYHHQVLQVDIKPNQAADVSVLKIPRSIDLLRIPNGKDFAVLPEVIQQLENLQLDDLPMDQRPMLELRIRLDKPEPSLRQHIEEAIAQLPIRLLKISTAYSGSEKSLADIKIEERLEELQPLDVFERCYQNKYDSQPPDEIKDLFNQLLESIQVDE